VTLFDRPGPRWFTIPAHRPFLDDLARGLHDALSGEGPEALAGAVVLTPTRRAARALADAFLRAVGGRPLLLPQIRALGDLEEGEPPFEPGDLALDLPPSIGAHRRRFELARLVAEHGAAAGRTLDASAALDLAEALGRLLDSAQIEEADGLEDLDGLVPEDLAAHWRVSAEFLRVAARTWPERLRELGVADVTARRVALLRALARRWTDEPPAGVLVAAGSTGAAPATADLLAAAAAAPRGATVLPGLDLDLAEDAWAQVDEQHPQGALSRLLRRTGVARAEVKVWPASPESGAGRSRRRLVNEALRPADATDDWLAQVGKLRAEAVGADPIAEGLQGLRLVSARDEEEAASAIALLLRETLETPGRTAALVTPDALLARRVSARLGRWGVEPDSSAGAPLSIFPVAVLAALTARLLAGPLDPGAALAVLKHPLVRMSRGRELDILERYGLRGSRPRGWRDVRDRLERAGEARMRRALEEGETQEAAARRLHRFEQAAELADDLEEDLATAAEAFLHGPATAAAAARAHVELLEELARDPHGGAGPLWGGPEGEAAAQLFGGLLYESEGLPLLTIRAYGELFARLAAGETVRSGGATHGRLRILGAIEARLVRADRLILAGLEEGVWPAATPTDPFLSRPMRARLGLPPPERRVGLAAHDFAQAACAPDVVLVHSERRGGQPAVKSRWLWRLQTLARGAGLSIPRADAVLEWARALDAPERFAPAERPRPTPPVAARPRKLPVTAVETWVRDPYAVYARHVLKLRRLDRPAEPFEAMARGSAVHKALERFALAWPAELPDACADLLHRRLLEELEFAGMGDAAMVREAVLAEECARWLSEWEQRRRAAGIELLVERTGAVAFEAPGGTFTLTAKADRIEVRGDRADILDFKTGAPPTASQIEAGFAPQLTLTAAILAEGGFEGVRARPGELGYIRLTGRKPPGEELIRVSASQAEAAAAKALEGLRRLVARFDDAAQPYPSWTAPQFMGRYGGEFDQLARLWEWHVVGLDDEDES